MRDDRPDESPVLAQRGLRRPSLDARSWRPIRAGHEEVRMESHGGKKLVIAVALWQLTGVHAWAVDPPCDAFPPAKQLRCVEVWKDLYKEDGPAIAQFGLDQLKRREEGKITAQQHLAQNMDFIKQATERRLARLNERMAKE